MLAAANGDQNAEFKVGTKSMGGPNLADLIEGWPGIQREACANDIPQIINAGGDGLEGGPLTSVVRAVSRL